MIVSANLLSQLPVVPMDAYQVRGREVPRLFGAQVITAHLALLDTLSRRIERVCLVTDTVQHEEDRSGQTTDQLDLMFGVTLPPPDQAWDWEIAPFGEASRHHRLLHRVHAYPDWRAVRPWRSHLTRPRPVG